MTHSSIATHPVSEQTDIPRIVRMSVVLGIIQAVVVALLAIVTRLVDGPLEKALVAVLLVIGLAATIILPGLWTRARSIEGIASAAGIGLGATVVFMLVDVAYQLFGVYTFRWREIGGGSNWWYIPVWWMAGTYLAWMGAYVMANQTEKRGGPSVGGLAGLVLVGALVFGVVAVLIKVPHAAWTVPTFGVAVIPALALAALVSGLGSRRP